MAFLAESHRSPRTSLGSFTAGFDAGNSPNSRHLTQWFNMSTPIGESFTYDPEASLLNAPHLRSSPRHHRHSCPPRPNCDGPTNTFNETPIASPTPRGTPRNVLGDWIYELRRVKD